jgi:hypothetical protein
MSQLNKAKNDTNPDQIYYDVTVSNFQSSTTNPQPFYFNDSRTVPFVNVPEDYYLSILRFTVDTGTIPVFLPSIQPNQADRDLTIYSVGMTWTDSNTGVVYSAQEYIKWEAQDLSVDVPYAPSNTFNGLQINDTGYYNCYSYSWLCYLTYVALQAVTVQMEVLTNGLPNQPDFTYSPVMNWDSTSQKAIIYANSATYNLNDDFYPVGFSAVNLYFNAPMYGLFSSFPARYLGNGTPFGCDYRILIVDVGGVNSQLIIPPQAIPAVGDPYITYMAITHFQETSTTANISPITSLVFTTNTLPIQTNQISTPLVYNNNQIINYAGNNSATANIITDLVSDTGTYSPNLVYTPSAEYRLITMYGNAPLINLDISIFYKIRNGSLVPFRLQSGGSVTMKLSFLKKSSRKG